MSSHITRLADLPEDIDDLAKTAHAEGFFMLDRLVTHFRFGKNTFSRPGEALFGVTQLNSLIGIGGLNIDPYFSDPQLGRVRHLYVHPTARNAGVGRGLVTAIEQHAARQFTTLQLYTPNSPASQFYEALGYIAVSGTAKVSHVKVFDLEGV